LNVADIAGLARIRHWVGRLTHDDERLSRDAVVTLHRSGDLVGRIVCASDDLAWTAYRIAAGMRFRVEDGAAWDAEPMALAA
jgi:hypothetical protein